MSTIIFAIILLHLALGFGYLIYKLSPRKKPTHQEETNINLK